MLAAVAANQGIESDLIPRMATAFCSGVAETGSTCGALNGAILGLSMVYGRGSTEDYRQVVYQKTQKLVTAFKENFEHLKCPDLLDLQLGTPEASTIYRERGLNKQCEGYVYFATKMAVELLQED